MWRRSDDARNLFDSSTIPLVLELICTWRTRLDLLFKRRVVTRSSQWAAKLLLNRSSSKENCRRSTETAGLQVAHKIITICESVRCIILFANCILIRQYGSRFRDQLYHSRHPVSMRSTRSTVAFVPGLTTVGVSWNYSKSIPCDNREMLLTRANPFLIPDGRLTLPQKRSSPIKYQWTSILCTLGLEIQTLAVAGRCA